MFPIGEWGNGLTSTIRGGGLSPRGGMGNSDKGRPRARLGHHAKAAKTHGPWSATPAGGTRPRAPASTQRAGHAGHHEMQSLSVEKHEPRPLKCGRPSRGSWGTTLVMAGP
ncbi:hypothetical protein Sjap_023009 [Stephania japonica]|uniref:Uncharacterized protein n=1 Tax=Stephania japonica TaxID=461633 RepID=A0AAP0HU47_9MAGN